jgi:hypothetical protein
MNEVKFLRLLQERGATSYTQALALLWLVGRDDPQIGLTAKQICAKLEGSGLPAQNASRLFRQLADDRATSKTNRGDAWRLHPTTRRQLDLEHGPLVQVRPPPPDSDSVIPRALVSARGYLEKVVFQLNASYALQLYDCCAVMCRRTVETLLIEVYEHAGRAGDVKGADGHFLMLNGLLEYFEKDKAFHPSRNALQGLRDFKKLGDLSAHNRRFNARKEDIDRVRDGVRVTVEELAHLAGLRP